jgi:hypothetical protein
MNNSRLLIGSWKLLSAEYRHGETLAHPFGRDPVGLLIYDNAGNMTVQIMHRDYPQRSVVQKDTLSGRAAFEGYLGYFGRYEIRETENTVMHYVTGSTLTHWVGSVQRRTYECSGNQLTLSTPAMQDQKGALAVLIWQRVEN